MKSILTKIHSAGTTYYANIKTTDPLEIVDHIMITIDDIFDAVRMTPSEDIPNHWTHGPITFDGETLPGAKVGCPFCHLRTG